MDLQTLVLDAVRALDAVQEYEALSPRGALIIAGIDVALRALTRLLGPSGMLDPIAILEIEDIGVQELATLNLMRQELGLEPLPDEVSP